MHIETKYNASKVFSSHITLVTTKILHSKSRKYKTSQFEYFGNKEIEK